MSLKIGFIGLGIMGKPMSKNLLKAGYSLVVSDLNQAAVGELIEAGSWAVEGIGEDFVPPNCDLSLVSSASELLGVGSEAAKDGRFCADERRALEPLLLALMKATGELLQSIRGGAL